MGAGGAMRTCSGGRTTAGSVSEPSTTDSTVLSVSPPARTRTCSAGVPGEVEDVGPQAIGGPDGIASTCGVMVCGGMTCGGTVIGIGAGPGWT